MFRRRLHGVSFVPPFLDFVRDDQYEHGDPSWIAPHDVPEEAVYLPWWSHPSAVGRAPDRRKNRGRAPDRRKNALAVGVAASTRWSAGARASQKGYHKPILKFQGARDDSKF